MSDPLAQVATLLKPSALHSKIATGAGPWSARRSDVSNPLYLAVVEGSCYLSTELTGSVALLAGDFVLIPSPSEYVLSSLSPAGPEDLVTTPTILPSGELRVGRTTGSHDVRILMGYCVFGAPDANFLINLLPQFLHIREEERLTTLVRLIVEEFRATRPARNLVLPRLLEVLFIEALRSVKGQTAAPGLLKGLADERVALALRLLHQAPEHDWTVAEIARRVALSRSSFFEYFRQVVGFTPIEYLLNWRMALAKDLLLKKEFTVSSIAESVGYSSANAFSVAFRRHVGLSPTRYARGQSLKQPIDSPDA